jgi:hypothetical protein
VRADVNASVERRAYSARLGGLGGQGMLGMVNSGGLDDSLRTAGASLSYAPTRKVQLGLTVGREQRGGARALGIGAYRATSVGVNLRLSF